MKKRNKIIYWVATVWLALGLISTGVVQLMREKDGAGGVDSVTHLGYPLFLVTLLGVWKLLAVVAVLMPRFPVLKEWAYAGCFFLTTGAIVSHVAAGNPMSEIFPSVLLFVLAMVSWYFRPADRKPMARASEIHATNS